MVFAQNAPEAAGLPFAVMNATEAYDFRGVAVATDLATASALLRCPGPYRKFFYVWDLEWVRGGGAPYEAMARLYRDPSLPPVARGDSHRRVIEACWNTRVAAVVPGPDPALFSELAKGSNGQA